MYTVVVNTKILNIVIIFSIAGIITLSIKEKFFKPEQSTVLIPPTTQSLVKSTLAPTDFPVPCRHSYFPFANGTRWTYQTIITSHESDKKTLSEDTLISTVKVASPSSILIESKFKKSGLKESHEIKCLSSGIYGLPFSVAGITTVQNQQKIRFLPSEKDTMVGREFISLTGVDFGISYLGNLNLQFKNQIKKQEVGNVAGQKERKILTIISSIDQPTSLQQVLGNNNLFSYDVSEGIGITRFSIDVNLIDVYNVRADYKLIGFQEGQ